jgi:hypothetical protein
LLVCLLSMMYLPIPTSYPPDWLFSQWYTAVSNSN